MPLARWPILLSIVSGFVLAAPLIALGARAPVEVFLLSLGAGAIASLSAWSEGTSME